MRWLVVLTLSACAPVPLPTGSIDPSQVDNGGFLSARSGLVGIQLGTPPQIQLPAVLVAFPDDMTNLLEPPPVGDKCSEGYVGVNLVPAARASASTTVGMSQVSVLLAGPAVARFMVEYSVPYDCQGMRTLSGKATFTMLPSGRIERLDESVVASATMIPSTDQCACAGSPTDHFFYSSFWSFKPGQDLTPTNTNRTVETGPGCTVTNGQTIAVKYDNADQRGLNGTHLVYFAVEDVPPFELTAPQRSHSSVAIAQGASCSDALARLDDPKIQIDGRDIGTEQGIYIEATPHTGKVEVKTSFPVPNGFALQIPLGGAKHARVLKDGQSVGFAVELDGAQPVFWFADAFMPNEVITIEPAD